MHRVSSELIRWYNANGRDLPWRKTRDPYHIWLSEVILQQTRVDQGLPYYLRFTESFPDVVRLAKAKEETVLKLWQGLGYYSRARNLHKAAKEVVSKFGGRFPENHEAIRSLPGIGDYTAAAISSFAFDQPYPVVDGNVFRFITRYFGIDTPIDSAKGKKEISAIAASLIKDAPPHSHNQAIMEFGARQCVPVNPVCNACPFHLECTALKTNRIADLPVKAKKQKTRDRHFNYLVVQEGNAVYMRQRKEKDIWNLLWEFPLIESRKPLTSREFGKSLESVIDSGNAKINLIGPMIKHVLSHQVLHTRFYEIELIKNQSLPEGWKRVPFSSLEKYPIPRLIDKYLTERKKRNR